MMGSFLNRNESRVYRAGRRLNASRSEGTNVDGREIMMNGLHAGLDKGFRWSAILLLVLSTGLMSSCSTVRGWRGGGDSSPAVQQSEAIDVKASVSELESELLQLVKRHVNDVEADSASNQSRIIRKRPYYFKEYGNYVGPASADRVVLTETESRTAPYIADVTLDKVRYATRLHRSREEARLDTSFLRDTGVETLSYELRSGRWIRIGSFFLAEKTEEEVNGEWVAVQRTLQRTVTAEEPEKGWFAQTWSRVTGKE